MSYKLDLSDIDRGAQASLTAQIAERLQHAIDTGALAPGEKLPTTRALAEQAGINHLTAVRVYRRLAEQGYVTASVGRGTFVRAVPPALDRDPIDWQTAVLPELRPSYSHETFAATYLIPSDPDIVSLAAGAPDSAIYPANALGRIAGEVLDEVGGDALGYLDPDGLYELREEIAKRGRRLGFAQTAEEIMVTSGARQAIDLVCRASRRAGRRRRLRVADVHRHPQLAAGHRRARDRRAGRRGRHGRRRARAHARPPRGQARGRPAGLPEPDRARTCRRRARAARRAGARALVLHPRGRRLRDGALRRRRPSAPAPLRARPRHLRRLAVEDGRRRPAPRVGGGQRAGAPAHELAQAPQRHAHLEPGPVHRAPLAAQRRPRGAPARLQPDVRASAAMRCAPAWSATWATRSRCAGPSAATTCGSRSGGRSTSAQLLSEAIRCGVTFVPGGAMLAESSPTTSMRLSFARLEPEELDEGVRRLAKAVLAVRHRASRPGRVQFS